MRKLKLTISFLTFILLFVACSQPDRTQCACFEQAKKVNQLSDAIWSSGATRQDTLLLKAALEKKDQLCRGLEQTAPDELLDLIKSCQ
jgi:predicted amidohydrolase YtcJ